MTAEAASEPAPDSTVRSPRAARTALRRDRRDRLLGPVHRLGAAADRATAGRPRQRRAGGVVRDGREDSHDHRGALPGAVRGHRVPVVPGRRPRPDRGPGGPLLRDGVPRQRPAVRGHVLVRRRPAGEPRRGQPTRGCAAAQRGDPRAREGCVILIHVRARGSGGRGVRLRDVHDHLALRHLSEVAGGCRVCDRPRDAREPLLPAATSSCCSRPGSSWSAPTCSEVEFRAARARGAEGR